MENSKRRRGISLIHNQPVTNSTHFSLEKTVPFAPQTTRIQNARYQVQLATSRLPSAPKTKVQFIYPIHISQVNQSTNPSCPQTKQPIDTHDPYPQKQEFHQSSKSQEQLNEVLVSMSLNPEQSKSKTGKRSQGVGSIVRRERVLQQSDRSNRLKESTHNAFCQTNIEQGTKKHLKSKEEGQYRKLRQLQIQREVVNYFAESKPLKQNQNQKSRVVQIGHNPLKLQQMEKRLMDLIKMCDDNLES